MGGWQRKQKGEIERKCKKVNCTHVAESLRQKETVEWFSLTCSSESYWVNTWLSNVFLNKLRNCGFCNLSTSATCLSFIDSLPLSLKYCFQCLIGIYFAAGCGAPTAFFALLTVFHTSHAKIVVTSLNCSVTDGDRILS